MIAVIADDFTGAAEIGGIGLRKGLQVLIQTSVEGSEKTELLIIATDTRSLSREAAKKEIEKVTTGLLALNPEYIFKKLDSVLRGNIYDELTAQMQASGKRRAIVVAGNPEFNRIIKNGIYFVDGKPLEQTFFAGDPQYPIKFSSVTKIIGQQKDVISLKVTDNLPEHGMIFGDVTSHEEMAGWSGKIDENTMAAGGSGFFGALLNTKYPDKPVKMEDKFTLKDRSLFIFGSTFPKHESAIMKFREANAAIINMPLDIYRENEPSPCLLEQWESEIADKLRTNKIVVLTINHEINDEEALSEKIKKIMGALINKIIKQVAVDDLLIEGGATTAMILKNLGIRKLHPFREIEFGVIQMRATGFPELCITTKPGSYLWPDCLLDVTG